jgi:hypothetical protein
MGTTVPFLIVCYAALFALALFAIRRSERP